MISKFRPQTHLFFMATSCVIYVADIVLFRFVICP